MSDHTPIVGVVSQRLNDHIEGFSEVAFEVVFITDRDKREVFMGRIETGIDPLFVAPRIDAVPAVVVQIDGVETVEAVDVWSVLRAAQALVCQSRRDAVGTEEGGQQMTYCHTKYIPKRLRERDGMRCA